MKKRHLSKSILRGCSIFALCLSLGVASLGFYTYTKGMIMSYQSYLRSILTYVAANLDGDDMAACIEHLTPSEKYKQAQIMVNEIKETHDIMYIYIMRPLMESGRDTMLYVMTGVTAQELREDSVQTKLGDYSGDEFDEYVSTHYMNCMYHADGVEFFANHTSFGYMYTGMIPIKASSGNTVAILSVDISIQELANTIENYIIICLAGCLPFSALYLWMLYRWMKGRVIHPIQQLEESARMFVTESHSDAGPDKLNYRMPDIHTGDEMQSLADTLFRMSEDVKTYMSDMLIQTREKERIASELSVATQIQADMLPSIFPAFPENSEFDIFAVMDPAKEVGGDFYDFFFVDKTHLAMVIADVSGKSVPAALFMVIAKTLLKNRAQEGGSPAEILRDVNNQLCEGNRSQFFVTVWLAILDISTGKGIAANAGHEHPVIRRNGGDFELVKYRHSPALAAMEGIPFREHTFALQPGDTLFVYTDGVPEATNASMELFGTTRMLQALNSYKGNSLEPMLNTVRSAINDFTLDAPQFDDITMLGFNFFGKQE